VSREVAVSCERPVSSLVCGSGNRARPGGSHSQPVFKASLALAGTDARRGVAVAQEVMRNSHGGQRTSFLQQFGEPAQERHAELWFRNGRAPLILK
jgi:hypothetical protein